MLLFQLDQYVIAANMQALPLESRFIEKRVSSGKGQGQPVGKLDTSIARVLQNLWLALHGKQVVAAIAGLLFGCLIGYSVSGMPITSQPELPSMGQCVSDTLNLFGQKSVPTPESLRDAREHCYSLIQAQGLLNDFAIRKLNFFQQYRANGVLMWMVVAVTISGVLLAGLQLWASYQLALANKTSLDANNGQLVLKTNQLALKSSITGLFILLISFCFFLVFVFYVYRFETLDDRTNPASQQGPVLPMGGLGPPPPAQVEP